MKVGVSEISPMMLGCLRYIFSSNPRSTFIRIPQVGWKWLLAWVLLATFLNLPLCFSAIATGMPTGLVALVVQSQAFLQ